MSVVVDSSVVVAALVDTGANGKWAEEIIAHSPLYGPELIRVEVSNVLRRLEQARQITAPEANAAYVDFMQLQIELYAFDPFSDRIWELRHNVTSYDAWYVAVAEALGLPLATLDERLAGAKGPKCRFIARGLRPQDP